MDVFASGPSGPACELRALVDAGHALRVGRVQAALDRQPYSEDELASECEAADVLMASHLEPVTCRVLERTPRLRLVVVPFIGVDRIDVATATRLGIAVANSPTIENFVGVAEAAIGLMLVLLKRVKHNEARLREGLWSRLNDRGELLFAKTVGIVGLGRTGIELARRLAPWGVTLLAADPFADEARAVAAGVRIVDLDILLRQSDVVTLHATVTAATTNLIAEATLAKMKTGAVLVNTARGALVDEAALAAALESGRLAGAALDSFQLEPLPPESPLRSVDPARLILTPHNVCQSQAGRRAGIELAITQILEAARGELPRHTLNPEVALPWRGRAH